MIINLGCASVDNHIPRDDIFDYHPIRECNIYILLLLLLLLLYTQEVKLKDFQFKINNHILVTKSFLYKINKTDNDRCSLCDRDSETISHLIYHCDKAKEFWSALKNWLQVLKWKYKS